MQMLVYVKTLGIEVECMYVCMYVCMCVQARSLKVLMRLKMEGVPLRNVDEWGGGVEFLCMCVKYYWLKS